MTYAYPELLAFVHPDCAHVSGFPREDALFVPLLTDAGFEGLLLGMKIVADDGTLVISELKTEYEDWVSLLASRCPAQSLQEMARALGEFWRFTRGKGWHAEKTQHGLDLTVNHIYDDGSGWRTVSVIRTGDNEFRAVMAIDGNRWRQLK